MSVVHTEKRGKLLSADEARDLRGKLKGALTAVASGRGSIEALLHEIERIAKYATRKPDVSLGRARKPMRRLVCSYAPAHLQDTGLPGVEWDALYKAVVGGRNDIAHTGTEGALTGMRVAALATVLLAVLGQAAKGGGSTGKVRDVMVSNPTCAHEWQTLADLRRTMLVNDFSVLPLDHGLANDGTWTSVRAEELASFIAKERDALGWTLADVRTRCCGSRMKFYDASVVQED